MKYRYCKSQGCRDLVQLGGTSFSLVEPTEVKGLQVLCSSVDHCYLKLLKTIYSIESTA